MNLVTEPWIPIIKHDGTYQQVSLLEVFQNGDQFADLAVRPHERIALMRLLICIAQAALDGPENYEDWLKALEYLPKAAEKYLGMENWRNSFELFYGPEDERKKNPFLQISDLKKPDKKSEDNEKDEEDTFVSIGKLDFALATGANTTLFDHGGTNASGRVLSKHAIPLMLLTFQNFSPGGTIGVALWNKKPTNGWSSYPKIKPGQSSHSLCLPKNMLHTFIRKKTLLQTICANLLTKKTVEKHFGENREKCWGKPVWECFPTEPNNMHECTRTYLGRLVPMTRAIQILPNGNEILLANGLDYPLYGNKKLPFGREVSATEVLNKDGTDRVLLSANFDKALWRELTALIALPKKDEDKTGGPLALRNIDIKQSFDIWVGALVADKASILDTVESVLHVPVGLMSEGGLKDYQTEVKWAEQLERKLKLAIREYRKQFDGSFTKIDDSDLQKNKKYDMEKRITHIAISSATRHYWTAAEKLRPLLMAYIDTFELPQQTLEEMHFAAEKRETAQTVWRKAVRHAAYEAYRLACGQETPRQIRAYALGWEKLAGRKSPSTENNQEPEIEPVED